MTLRGSAVLRLSHLHGDHWDRVARRNLDKDLPVVTTRHAARWLRPQGFGEARGLRTITSPLADFDAEARRRGLDDKVRVVQRGAAIAL
ncbi:MBL fold metallo-hydrolase [Actinoallomurus sp. CA-150999]|uniref:MBL fold metallo-hydrolase n=1 Tax=Actinoallomurus sp. CA-150999 TaxID=3239887 RepID=UPI003D8A809B